LLACPLIALLCLTLATPLLAQEPPAPPPPQTEAQPKPPAQPGTPKADPAEVSPVSAPSPEPHRFFDRTNKQLFAGVFAARALDFGSTLNMRARGRDEILLTNEVVDNKPAFVAIELAATACSIGVSYWLHRKGRHTLERWVSIVHISVGAFGGVRNYLLETRRTTPIPSPTPAALRFPH
jgi:hypothetical protein